MVGRSVRLWVAVILMLACAGCATIDRMKQQHRLASEHREQVAQANAESKADRTQKRKEAQNIARLRRLQSELVAHGDPDSLVAGALVADFLAGSPNSTALELTARAVAAAPDRADLALLQLQLCENAPGCDALALETRLRQLDPQNGITWTYALARADRDNQSAAWLAARDGLAQSTRVDLYWTRTVTHLATAVAGKAGFDTSAAVLEVTALEGSLVPTFQPLSRACQAQEIQRPDVLTQCRQIAAAFRHGDTAFVEAVGSSLAIRLWPDRSPENLAIVSERRALRYRVDLMTRNATKLNSPQALTILAGLLPQYPTEQTAFRALFVHLGLMPDPPAGWVDPQPGG